MGYRKFMIFDCFLLFLLMIVTWLNVFVSAAKGFQQPELARLMFFHVSCALVSLGFQIWSTWASYKYLKTKANSWGIKLFASLEMSWLLAFAGMITGILFSKVQWGAWWQWDPRQTSYLMQLMILSAAMTLKNLQIKKYQLTSVYILFSFIPSLFLVYIFPRLPQTLQASFHPSQSLWKGELDFFYQWTLRFTAFTLLLICYRLYKQRTDVEELLCNE